MWIFATIQQKMLVNPVLLAMIACYARSTQAEADIVAAIIIVPLVVGAIIVVANIASPVIVATDIVAATSVVESAQRHHVIVCRPLLPTSLSAQQRGMLYMTAIKKQQHADA